ncbi:MAG: PHP domain-containing protein [Desulfobacterales bacterium]|nr:PHP domain-containing protein [Desulfobacterales bacterium]
MKFDLHVHSTVSSCSRLTLEQIVNHAAARGLDGVCITDHDSMAAGEHIAEGPQENGLCIIIGMEYTTAEGDFLLFGPFEEMVSGLSAPELLRRVEAAGGVAVAAHPCRPARATSEELIAAGLCRIVEGLNGRNQDRDNQRISDWQKRYSIRQVGGSDAHTLEELGRMATRFDQPIRNRADLIQALKRGGYAPVGHHGPADNSASSPAQY